MTAIILRRLVVSELYLIDKLIVKDYETIIVYN